MWDALISQMHIHQYESQRIFIYINITETLIYIHVEWKS